MLSKYVSENISCDELRKVHEFYETQVSEILVNVMANAIEQTAKVKIYELLFSELH